MLATFSNTAGSAALLGNQVYGPYGTSRYQQGTMGTNKGFTGQYNDSVTGLDYYNSRYYDPVAGVFLSADKAQGNLEGMNPYAYVGGNPETQDDPSGQFIPTPGGGAYYPPPPPIGGGTGSTSGGNPYANPYGGTVTPPSSQNSCGGFSQGDCLRAVYAGNSQWQGTTETSSQVGGGFTRVCLTACILIFNPQVTFTTQSTVTGSSVTPLEGCASILACFQEGGGVDEKPIDDAGAVCSFTAQTEVSTEHGQQPIGKLHAGEEVLAYNPQTHKMELQPILHVWIHPDNDLIDLKISMITATHQGKAAKHTDEVVHTTSKHPFLTTEHGFLPAGKIRVGMHVLRADGSEGVITGWKVVPGTKVMYNLEVARDHTFTVGEGQWVVHNCNPGPPVTLGQVSPVVGELAQATDEARTASGTVRMVPGGPRTPNFAGVMVEALNVDGSWEAQMSTVFQSAGDDAHSEKLAVDWATERLSGMVDQWGATKGYRVSLVTQYFPCKEICQPAIDSGEWQQMLDNAAGQSVNFQIWHYMDDGMFRIIHPN